ncbi:MAG: hypothetical protein V1712_01400 [Patescibacteria group bacterium]
MSTKLWLAIILLVLGLVGILTLGDYWQLIAVLVTGVGLVILILATVAAKKTTPPPTTTPTL